MRLSFDQWTTGHVTHLSARRWGPRTESSSGLVLDCDALYVLAHSACGPYGLAQRGSMSPAAVPTLAKGQEPEVQTQLLCSAGYASGASYMSLRSPSASRTPLQPSQCSNKARTCAPTGPTPHKRRTWAFPGARSTSSETRADGRAGRASSGVRDALVRKE